MSQETMIYEQFLRTRAAIGADIGRRDEPPICLALTEPEAKEVFEAVCDRINRICHEIGATDTTADPRLIRLSGAYDVLRDGATATMARPSWCSFLAWIFLTPRSRGLIRRWAASEEHFAERLRALHHWHEVNRL